MRYPGSEKLEIIRLVEGSHLPVNRTLEKLGVSRPTFYRWCDLYQRFGEDGLEDRRSGPGRVWNRIPDEVRGQLIDLALVVDLDRRQHRPDAAPAVEALALDQPELLPQQGGNDAHLQHAGPSMKFFSSLKPARELFSGWNWVPQTCPRRTAAVTGTP